MKAKTIESKRGRSRPVPGHLMNSSTEAEGPTSIAGAKQTFVDAEQRKAMIAEAAYYKAEHRGFASGYELEDWLVAEAEIDSALSGDSLLSG